MAEGYLPEYGRLVDLGDLVSMASGAVYFLYSAGDVVYVGQTANLRLRIGQHFIERRKDFDAVSFIPCAPSSRSRIERHFIERLLPKYNICKIATELRSMDSNMRNEVACRSSPPLSGRLLTKSEIIARLNLSEQQFAQMRVDGLPRRRTPRRNGHGYDLSEAGRYAACLPAQSSNQET